MITQAGARSPATRGRWTSRIVVSLMLSTVGFGCTGGAVVSTGENDGESPQQSEASAESGSSEGSESTAESSGNSESSAGSGSSGDSDSPEGSEPTQEATDGGDLTGDNEANNAVVGNELADGSDQSEALLAAMTIESKVGQLLMPVLSGTNAAVVTDEQGEANEQLGLARTPAELVASYRLGGVLLLGPNIESAEQLVALNSGLQSVAPAELGLLVSVDQEGGRVNRVTDGVTVFGSARSMGGEAGAVRRAALTTARELSELGINVVLAPVADVEGPNGGVLGDRSYGSDPSVVSEMVVAAVSGLQAGGVAATVKHWPGHGATSTDSHDSLPVLTQDEVTWRSQDSPPFQAAITAGVDVVMVGHLALPSVDPSGVPATVSPVLIEGELRNQLGFDGVVMTDALNMGALEEWDQSELVVRAILAGADILLAPPDLPVAARALVSAVVEGRITEERLDRSVRRVISLKEKLGLVRLDE